MVFSLRQSMQASELVAIYEQYAHLVWRSCRSILRDDAAAVEKEGEAIKARYSKIFHV